MVVGGCIWIIASALVPFWNSLWDLIFSLRFEFLSEMFDHSVCETRDPSLTIIFCPFLAVHYYLMWSPRAIFLVVVGSWGSQLSQMMHTSNTSYICWKNEALSSKLQNWIFDTIWLIFLCFKNCLFHTTHPNYKIDKNDSHAYCRAPRPVPPT